MKILISIACFLSLISCSPNPPNSSAAINTSSPAASPEKVPATPVIPKDTSTHNQYAWLSNASSSDRTLINQIPSPNGYHRIEIDEGTYGDWLRHLPLKEPGSQVLLFDGRLKGRQDVHTAVVDIDVGKRDLQQCADALMRLRAEYLYSVKKYQQIHFNYTSGDKVSFEDWRWGRKPKIQGNRVVFSPKTDQANNSYKNFKSYLIQIFSYAGTASLSKELVPVEVADMQIGDIFILGGFPGHAVAVVDMVVNELGDRRFLLAQSYMPAQNIHILKNHSDETMSPWYPLDFGEQLYTPEWSFTKNQLYRFAP